MGLRLWGKNRPEADSIDDQPLVMDRTSAATADDRPVKPPKDSARQKQLELEQQLRNLQKEHEALTARYTNLERLLADPEDGQNAILYYRLCDIWRMCNHNLVSMSKRFTEKYQAQSGTQGKAKLPIGRRRTINILLLAMAQEYYLLFSESQIANMARQATSKSVDAVHFGMAEECLDFAHKARELTARARSEGNFGDTLRRRAKYLHESLKFEGNATVPREDSINSMPNRVGSGAQTLNDYSDVVPVNVLALDYWDLKAVLLR